MLLWILLTAGLVSILTIGTCVRAMGRAERRARRSLYRSLGLTETTVDFLMERNREVLTELRYVRDQGEAAVAEARDRLPSPARVGRPNLRLVQPEPRSLEDEAGVSRTARDGDAAAETRH